LAPFFRDALLFFNPQGITWKFVFSLTDVHSGKVLCFTVHSWQYPKNI
jgi:hypothetical protein